MKKRTRIGFAGDSCTYCDFNLDLYFIFRIDGPLGSIVGSIQKVKENFKPNHAFSIVVRLAPPENLF